MGTLRRRAVYGALVTFLACHSAAVDAVTLATAQNSISASVSLSGLPDTAVCGPVSRVPGAAGFASGHAFATATTNTPSDTAVCASSSPGSYSMTYSGLLQSAESGLLIDSGGGQGFASYGFGQEMNFQGDEFGFGFFIPGPLTLSLSYDVSFALAVSTATLPVTGTHTAATTSGLIVFELCRWDPNLFCTELFAWQAGLLCPTAPATPCVAAVSGTESRVLDIVIPESGFWSFGVVSASGGQVQVFQPQIPEPSSFALLLLGLFGMAAGRCARRRLA